MTWSESRDFARVLKRKKGACALSSKLTLVPWHPGKETWGTTRFCAGNAAGNAKKNGVDSLITTGSKSLSSLDRGAVVCSCALTISVESFDVLNYGGEPFTRWVVLLNLVPLLALMIVA